MTEAERLVKLEKVAQDARTLLNQIDEVLQRIAELGKEAKELKGEVI